MASRALSAFTRLSQIAITKREMHHTMPERIWQNQVFQQQIVSGIEALFMCVRVCVSVYARLSLEEAKKSFLSSTAVQFRRWQLNHRLLGQKEKNQWLLNSLCEVISKAVTVESQISTWLRAGEGMQRQGEEMRVYAEAVLSRSRAPAWCPSLIKTPSRPPTHLHYLPKMTSSCGSGGSKSCADESL